MHAMPTLLGLHLLHLALLLLNLGAALEIHQLNAEQQIAIGRNRPCRLITIAQ